MPPHQPDPWEATLSTPTTPFTDPALIRGTLYASADRLGRRTSALHRAKVAGADAAATIAALAMAANPSPARVADIGCGRGTTTAWLAGQHPAAAVVAIDLSPALLAAARDRLHAANRRAGLVGGDFHHLPLATGSLDLAVAAFCLYHSPHPAQALTEIGRCLHAGGHLIAATKAELTVRRRRNGDSVLRLSWPGARRLVDAVGQAARNRT